MNDIEVTFEQTDTFNTEVYDVNYLPDYVKAEQERRANEVIRISNETTRQDNEADRIALYNESTELITNVNSIIDYFDKNFTLEEIKTGLSKETGELTGDNISYVSQ